MKKKFFKNSIVELSKKELQETYGGALQYAWVRTENGYIKIIVRQ